VPLVKTLGVVVRKRDIGEADRLLTLLTLRYGKMKAVAKGCRRPKSRLGGNLEPLAVAEFMLWVREGKELALVRGAELVETFPLLESDLRAFASAQCAAELMDRSLVGEEAHPRLYHLLVDFLRSLEGSRAADGLLRFSLRAVELLGYGCRGDKCASCAGAIPEEPGPLWMEYTRGGVLCGKCAARASGGEKLSARVAGALRAAAGGRRVGEGPATEAVRALDRMLSWHQDRKVLVSPRLLTALAAVS